MIYLTLLIIILLQSVSDGLRERSLKKWSKRLEHLSIGLFFVLPLAVFKDISWIYFLSGGAKESLWIIVQVWFCITVLYLFIRAYLFDPVVHTVSGWKINTVGTTSPLWDKLMGRLHSWQFWVMRGFFLALSIFWYYKAIINY